MGDFYKVVIDAKAYPDTPPRCIKIEKGDVILISNTDSDMLSVGDMYKNYNAVVSEVLKEPRRWWQFWRKPMVLGYEITFL